MYRGKSKEGVISMSQSVSFMNKSNITQSQTDILQKEVDNYTRKLEQEKRRFFRVQQNHREVLKQLTTKNQQLEQLKTRKFKTEMEALRAKAKEKEKALEKAIASYNQALSRNSSLKADIDELRKEKKSSIEVDKLLKENIEALKESLIQKKKCLAEKENHIKDIKQMIINIKNNNEGQSEEYKNRASVLEGSFVNEEKSISRIKNNETIQKNEAVDTHPIVKLRLKNTLQKNKEKLRLIEQYKKNMTIIWKAFQEMKHESGISDLEKLTQTILKQEEQDLFIYHFIDKLTKNIECLNDTHKELTQKITNQVQVNQKYRAMLAGTSQAERDHRQHQNLLNSKKEVILNFQQFLANIEPELISTLRHFGYQQYQIESPTSQNIQSLLSKIEEISGSVNENEEKNQQPHKQEVTKYSKAAPTIMPDQLKDKQDDRIIQNDRLRQFASDYWEKKKNKTRQPQQ